MKSPKKKKLPSRPVAERAVGSYYTLEVVCEIAGVPRRTVLRYEEHGLISAIAGHGSRKFDDETLRALRRAEHLRVHYEMNMRTLKFALGLLGELERLRDNPRSLR